MGQGCILIQTHSYLLFKSFVYYFWNKWEIFHGLKAWLQFIALHYYIANDNLSDNLDVIYTCDHEPVC